MLNVWSTAADERVVNYFQQSEISSANHFTIMRSKSEPNFSREEPKRQQLTVTLIYTSLIEKNITQRCSFSEKLWKWEPRSSSDKNQLPEQRYVDL